ncbi:hypothetical protein BDV96DRAFT_639275 [Lophiotrema nucula]|uniref:SET domain-containing protein n=1 Tax=Lophiotrema nucula TaxID=690887 RepID=A0A6A5ZWF7_9PLEO|nr:hypothetical protein BDV96DRAFT_639275 [Lophiotrema nucula]
MGADAGFDMVPRLSKGVVDRHNWKTFIELLQEKYKDDPKVENKPNYILFKAGEYPMLPFEGHKFLRFSSKVTGSNAEVTGVTSYIKTVKRVAMVYFGSRIHYWSELADNYGVYDWKEVNESLRSYEQRDEPEIPTTIAAFISGNDPIKELGIPIFETKDIPGKGRGLIARFNISPGTRILCEKPIFTSGPMPIPQLQVTLAAKLKALPKAAQRQFLSLHNNFPGKYPFSYTFKTNALPCGPDSPVGGVYPTICLINHSCIPNSHNNWNSDAKHETIYATRPIKAGEEITISYDRGGPANERRATLKSSFGFECDCRICSLAPSELQASDARRVQIQSLDDAIGSSVRMQSKPKDVLGDCHLLLQTLKDEYDGYAGIHNARVYYDAFQVSIAHGDQARASIFADRAYKARAVCEGEDSPEAKRMHGFAQKPASHRNFQGCSSKWKTTRGMIPKGLDTEAFEKWLFRV